MKHYEETILQIIKNDYRKNSKNSELIADKIAEFGGSWKFIGILSSILFFWVVWNILPFTYHFDEKPFVLLNLLLSCTASFQAPIIMMSQNRKAIQDKNEDIIDFAINYKSEKEINDMQLHLHKIEKDIAFIKEYLKK